MEIWEAVNGYEGIYEVSNHGNVRSLSRVTSDGRKLKEKILKQKKGLYLSVNLNKDGAYKSALVHRIVAKTFLLNPDNKSEVNHKDGDRFNNSVGNLEWVTPKENIKHALENGLIPKGEQVYNSKLTKIQVLEIYECGKKGQTQRTLAKKFKVSQSTIGGIIRNERWKWLTANK